MPATYEPIASVTLGSTTANIEFASLPGSFTDLVVVGNFRSDRTSSSGDQVGVRFNGAAGTAYSFTNLYGTGSSAVAERLSSHSKFNSTAATGPTAAANVFGYFSMHLMSYANTNVYKTALIAALVPSSEVSRTVGLYQSTSAITSILLFPVYGSNWVSGTTAQVYGIKAA